MTSSCSMQHQDSGSQVEARCWDAGCLRTTALKLFQHTVMMPSSITGDTGQSISTEGKACALRAHPLAKLALVARILLLLFLDALVQPADIRVLLSLLLLLAAARRVAADCRHGSPCSCSSCRGHWKGDAGAKGAGVTLHVRQLVQRW